VNQRQQNHAGLQDEALWGELNNQTARVAWQELEKHFARGVLVAVAPDMDLVEVAVAMVRDNTGVVSSWVSEGKVVRATDEQALEFSNPDAELWAVVAAPWVLVQKK